MGADDILSHLPELTVGRAEHWIAAAMAEFRALRQYDDDLFPLVGKRDRSRQVAGLLAAWQQWADRAAALHARLPALRYTPNAGPHVYGADDLGHAIARTRLILQAAAGRDAESGTGGKFQTTEEIRRELRDRAVARNAGVAVPA